jgi:fatty acid desaturase
MTTPSSSRSRSTLPIVATVLAIAPCAALYYVAGMAGIVVFAISAPFAIWIMWATQHVPTIEEHLAAHRNAAPAPKPRA